MITIANIFRQNVNKPEKNMQRIIHRTIHIVVLLLCISGQLNNLCAQNNSEENPEKIKQSYTLDECIEKALEQHVKQQISRASIKIAEAQRKQVLSAYWPQLSASALYSVTDQRPNFIFPESNITLPSDFTQLLETLGFDISSIQIPEQHVNLMDYHNLTTSINVTFPLYTGGIRSALKKQTELGIQIAENDMQKTRYEIIRDVKKYYYAVILTEHLLAIGQEAFERLNATLDLTEALYKNGSGRVKKTDYLKNKIIVDNVKIIVLQLEKNYKLAQSALKFSIGLPWKEQITLTEDVIPFQELHQDLGSYIDGMLSENLELQKVKLATHIFDQKVKESKGYLRPHVGLMGQYTQLFNNYDYGIMTPENKQIWMVGLGINYSLFKGFRYKNKVQENISRANQLNHQYTLLKNGLTLMMQSHFYQLMAAQESVAIANDVYSTSAENLDLVKRCYQIEILTEKDLIEAQIIEALMKANLEKSLYDHFQIRTDLEYIMARQMSDFMRKNQIKEN